MTLAFLALLRAPYIYDISSLRVKGNRHTVGAHERCTCTDTQLRIIKYEETWAHAKSTTEFACRPIM